ncbi:MAG: beta-ketoacyl-[acyl-carrier-protein] synthase family protein [Planctomycetaceae bacterium]|nr:beta-ketoacyl-[acyl-carrier-protein] synthase family protein [Planctomycetaceae bacterium]
MSTSPITLRLPPERFVRRVVITGLGVVSPIGLSPSGFWDALVGGHSGISRLAGDDPESRGPACGGAITAFQGRIEDFGELPDDLRKSLRKSLKVMNRETQLAVAAAQQAFRDSRLAPHSLEPDRCGVSFGAGYVGIRPDDFVSGVAKCRDAQGGPSLGEWGEKGLPEVHPLWLLTCLPNMPGCYIAMYNNFQGPNNTITLGDGAANLALLEAADLIRDGDADVMLAGGCGNQLDSCSLLHAVLDDDLARRGDDPAGILRPFDRDRIGSLPAEGAAAFVLEELQAARNRGATIYGEVLGGGASCVVERGIPNRSAAMAHAMRSALSLAGLTAAEVSHVQAHGLSSRRVDLEEARAIQQVFAGDSSVSVTAAKGHFGDAGAGAGALELAAGLLALRNGRLFPVLNCEHPDPDCGLELVHDSDTAAGESFLKLSVTPQGQASALIVRAAA